MKKSSKTAQTSGTGDTEFAHGAGVQDLGALDPMQIFESAVAMVTIVGTDGLIERANPHFCAALGYPEDAVIGKSTADFYAPSETVRFDDIHSVLTSGQCWIGKQRMQRASGAQFWVRTTVYPVFDAAGRHCRSLSVRFDINREEQARSDRDMLDALDLFRDEMFIITSDSLRFTYINRAGLETLGWSRDDMTGQTIDRAAHLFERDSFVALTTPLLRGAVPEVSYIREDGARAYEVTLRLTTTEGKAQRFVAIARDISERLALERAKADFTATVSHELRSPLTSIKGGIGLVLSGAAGAPTDKARSLLEIAHRNADRLVLIVNDMLDLEKIAAGQMTFNMKRVAARTLMTDAIDANAGYLAQYGVIARACSDDMATQIDCDPDRMLQVLGNLITNAAKFSDEGQEIRLDLRSDRDTLTFTVQDFGTGIPASAQATIFDRFTQAGSQTRARSGSTGLGLSIVKAIVDSHGGHIDMHSVEGEGTRFDITLPKRQSDNGNSPAQRAG
ncbi:PAS domain-containing sensor histidine kinase [Sulfitobacter albidus]|uniref:histidine kinase n=1 Tax=Sulfitobacter albidus TaxID=2829501 RepID=A0A975PN01_9RHOB|nr:PAS domain-containing sensor histidine kinase [Sulfitobacter albidus]QUJ77239.1 PAS domain-containing sensor histidine kinase [Sulfitobacter albidus]